MKRNLPFSIASLLGENSPKRTRSASPVQEFYKLLAESRHVNDKYKGVRYVANYILEQPEESVYPEEILTKVFQRSVDEALRIGKKQDLEPNKLHVTISSELLDYDIEVWIHQINEGTVEQIFAAFKTIDQSNKNKDGDRGQLYGEPFRVDILGFAVDKLREAVNEGKGKKKHRGGHKRRLQPIRHNFNRDGLAKTTANNDDNLCLFRAIVLLVARATMENRFIFRTYLENKERILADIHMLMDSLNIPRDEPGYDIEDYGDQIQQYYDQPDKFPGKFKIFAFKTIGLYKPFCTSNVERFEKPIALYFDENHYEPISIISTFVRRPYYCFTCCTPYHDKKRHAIDCKSRCMLCCDVHYSKCPCLPDGRFYESCLGCCKTFSNSECYENHLSNNACTTSKQCEKCKIIYRLEHLTRKGREGHKCDHFHCDRCHGYHIPNRGCSMRKVNMPKDKDYRIVIFDFECTQNFQPLPDVLRFEHQVNFASATVVCTRCIASGTWKQPLAAECDICGNHRTHAWAVADFNETAFDYKDISPNPLRAFVKWLLFSFNNGKQKKFETIALSHFGGRYDMTLVFGEIFRLGGLCPSIIRQGCKLFEIEAKKKGIITSTYFRDSYNIMPVSLARLIDCFGLTEVENKQYFPHLWNINNNLDVVLPRLPPATDYLFKSMKPDKRDDFVKWYSSNRNQPFLLRERLAEYCGSDVKILLHAVIEMQKLFKEITGLDVFQSKTIASAVMKHFRVNHLEPFSLALVPENGYEAEFKQSQIAKKYLKWLAQKHGGFIQTCDSVRGEKRCGKYWLDGFVKGKDGERDLAIEINGCYWHACKEHYPDDNMICGNRQLASVIRENNRIKENFIRQHYELKVVWECEIKAMLKTEPGMQEFFDSKFDDSAIRLRDAFFGGRTGPEKLHAVAEPGTKIVYLDFQSLYPSRQYYEEFPIGHPDVKQRNEIPEKPWTSSIDNPYKGLIKCLVEPPRVGLPVLPMRLDNDSRLLFPLCHKCAKENKVGKLAPDYNCRHFDLKERWFVTTITHLELNAALDAGYKVHKIYRTYTWKKWSTCVFKNYIKEFLRIKIESSGWPKHCKHSAFNDNTPLPDEDDPSLSADQRSVLQRLINERQNFVSETNYRYDIELRPEKMHFNPGLRYIAKLALNSLWGRFALRNNLSKTVITDSPEKLLEFFDNYRIEMGNINQLNDDALMITYCEKTEYIEEHSSSNIVISIFTTSAARVHLYKALQKVYKHSDAEILYMDTDSIIYSYKENPNEEEEIREYYSHVRFTAQQFQRADPLYEDRGKHLGELMEEYEDYDIQEFISGASKCYMLRIQKKDQPDSRDEYINKIRGLTFDHTTCRRLTFEEFKRRVLNYGNNEPPLALNYQMLRPNKIGQVNTIPMTKHFRPIITKGVILEDNKVVPFGYSNPEDLEIDNLHKEATVNNERRMAEFRQMRERVLQNIRH